LDVFCQVFSGVGTSQLYGEVLRKSGLRLGEQARCFFLSVAGSCDNTLLIPLLAFIVASGIGVTQTNLYLKDRCAQLGGYYDYYGASRAAEATDGPRHHMRIRASIDCERGNYEAGIKTIKALMIRKNMPVPCADIASTPDGRVIPIDPARIAPHPLDQSQNPGSR
jgi:hypothetical protein